MAPDACKWPVGVVPAPRRELGALPGVCGAQMLAAAGVAVATLWCGLRSAVGWGAAG